MVEQMKKNADADRENRKLNIHVYDLKKRVPGEIYVPMKHDPVDQKLSKYINSANGMDPALPRYMFRREGEGIYYFGTKKIYLKLLNDCIMVRVGGGYQSLDEFVNQHGEEEILKMQREEMRAAFFEQPLPVCSNNTAYYGDGVFATTRNFRGDSMSTVYNSFTGGTRMSP